MPDVKKEESLGELIERAKVIGEECHTLLGKYEKLVYDAVIDQVILTSTIKSMVKLSNQHEKLTKKIKNKREAEFRLSPHYVESIKPTNWVLRISKGK